MLPDTVPAADVERTLRTTAGDAARGGARASTSSAPSRSAPAAGAWRSRCASGAPDHTLTDTEIAELRQACIDAVDRARTAPSCADDGLSAPFVHQIRPRYAEVDQQGVVFNAHWLTYFDDACTRFFEWLGYTPKEAFFGEFDVMIVKAVLEWEGPAGFDDIVDIVTEPVRLGHEVVRSAVPRVGRRPTRRAPASSPT